MQYKTITLELIQSHPEFHARLARSNSLLSTMNQLSEELRENHLAIIEQLRQKLPQSTDLQLKSEALEIAIERLKQNLNNEEDSEILSLDGAMAYLKRLTPRG